MSSCVPSAAFTAYHYSSSDKKPVSHLEADAATVAVSWEFLMIMLLSCVVFFLATASVMMRKRIAVMNAEVKKM